MGPMPSLCRSSEHLRQAWTPGLGSVGFVSPSARHRQRAQLKSNPELDTAECSLRSVFARGAVRGTPCSRASWCTTFAPTVPVGFGWAQNTRHKPL